ncbi:HXXXD-type acyl-transferase family protein, partial [Striga asiatica]
MKALCIRPHRRRVCLQFHRRELLIPHLLLLITCLRTISPHPKSPLYINPNTRPLNFNLQLIFPCILVQAQCVYHHHRHHQSPQSWGRELDCWAIKAWSSLAKLDHGENIKVRENENLPPPRVYNISLNKDLLGLVDVYLNQMRALKLALPPLTSTANKVRVTLVLQKNEIKALQNSLSARYSALPHLLWACLTQAVGSSMTTSSNTLGSPSTVAAAWSCPSWLLIANKMNKKEELLRDADEWLVKYWPLIGKRAFGFSGSLRFDLYDGADFWLGKPAKYEAVLIDGDRSMTLCKSRDFKGGLEIERGRIYLHGYKGNPTSSNQVDPDYLVSSRKLEKWYKNVDEGFVFFGDTAQTIARGIDFCFEDIRSLFYTEFYMKSRNGDFRGRREKGHISDIFCLSQNFRTYTGVLRLAHSVIDTICHFFPLSIDVLPPETSLIYGESPVVLEPRSDENLIMTIFGHSANAGRKWVGFGADQ